VNDDPRHILKIETLDKGQEYTTLVLERTPSGRFQVSIRDGVPGWKDRTKYHETFATREEADHAWSVKRTEVLNVGFNAVAPPYVSRE